ncbi:MAG: hypothetical protein WCP55_17275, partial [Lentisphaerota bacterium]
MIAKYYKYFALFCECICFLLAKYSMLKKTVIRRMYVLQNMPIKPTGLCTWRPLRARLKITWAFAGEYSGW